MTCSRFAYCNNINGSCQCEPGYKWNIDGQKCTGESGSVYTELNNIDDHSECNGIIHQNFVYGSLKFSVIQQKKMLEKNAINLEKLSKFGFDIGATSSHFVYDCIVRGFLLLFFKWSDNFRT